jgi:hypothetical protein
MRADLPPIRRAPFGPRELRHHDGLAHDVHVK